MDIPVPTTTFSHSLFHMASPVDMDPREQERSEMTVHEGLSKVVCSMGKEHKGVSKNRRRATSSRAGVIDCLKYSWAGRDGVGR